MMATLGRRVLCYVLALLLTVPLLVGYFIWSDHTRAVHLKMMQIHHSVSKLIFQNENQFDKPINDTRFIASRWIIVTTISPPTDDVMALSKIPGWQLLVVGDTKTPKDWSCMGAIFLSVEDQASLEYSIFEVIPYNAYTRKNIGYLYAIQHGAKIIYETDDDNHPTDNLKTFLYKDNMTIMEAPNTKVMFNPYAHFGQGSIWPRGYPLERIGITNSYTYRLCDTKRPAVQQGVVDGDPDVDAIFRLTRKNQKAPINVKFDRDAPPITLGPTTFCPYNSQNTLFHYEAFWSLVLPISVAFRVTDIWRSYWAQGLLRLIGERVMFLPPNAVQVRNPHSYMADFADEMELYLKAGVFVNLLSQWRCSESTLAGCANELTLELAQNSLLGSSDVEMIQMWFNDLRRIGYRFPAINKDNPCRGSARLFKFSPKQQSSVFQTSQKLLHLVK